MYYNTPPTPHTHDESTPYQKCREILLELNIEQRKGERKDLDKISSLRHKLNAFTFGDITKAFDSIVDIEGWGDQRRFDRRKI